MNAVPDPVEAGESDIWASAEVASLGDFAALRGSAMQSVFKAFEKANELAEKARVNSQKLRKLRDVCAPKRKFPLFAGICMKCELLAFSGIRRCTPGGRWALMPESVVEILRRTGKEPGHAR